MSNYLINIGKKSKKALSNNLFTNHIKKKVLDKFNKKLKQESNNILLQNRKDLKYARIDFYDTEEKVFFSEITLTPMGGFLSYFTQEALNYMGKAIRLNSN